MKLEHGKLLGWLGFFNLLLRVSDLRVDEVDLAVQESVQFNIIDGLSIKLRERHGGEFIDGVLLGKLKLFLLLDLAQTQLLGGLFLLQLLLLGQLLSVVGGRLAPNGERGLDIATRLDGLLVRLKLGPVAAAAIEHGALKLAHVDVADGAARILLANDELALVVSPAGDAVGVIDEQLCGLVMRRGGLGGGGRG